MVIRHNISALNTNNTLNITRKKQLKAAEKLSSGLRINRAADDAAGLSISEKMRAQIRGLNQAKRNVQDGISLIQVADGALNEVGNCLQRMKELSTQAANGTYSGNDRQNIQTEIDSLLAQIDNIANKTKFNNIALLDGSRSLTTVSQSDKQKFIGWLNGSWLNDAAQIIESTTGWTLGSDTTLSVSFENIGGTVVATMSGWYLGSDLTLTINTNYMEAESVYQGTDGPNLGRILADRLITHEMVHGFMFNNVSSVVKPPSWFVEGIAEGVNGASDYRYSLYESGFSTDFSSVNAEIQNFDFLNNEGGYNVYTVGYLATSYLYNQIEGQSAGSFKTMLAEMSQNDETFEELIVKYTGSADYADFISTMKQQAQDALDSGDFNGIFLKGICNIDLTDGKADPLNGNDQISSDVIPNSGGEIVPADSVTSLTVGSTSISVNWGDISMNQPGAIVLQIGDKEGQTLEIPIGGARSSDLSVNDISVTSQVNARHAIESCDAAIDIVSGIRSTLGAYQNRLEHTMNNLSTATENTQSAESRIRDVDMAKELMEYEKNNILAQAGQFMLAQANMMPNSILRLLQ